MTDKTINTIIMENGFNFKPHEFLDGREHLQQEIIRETVRFRAWHGFSTLITSAYRSPSSEPHEEGLAIDSILYNTWGRTQPDPMEIYTILTTWPWQGVGIYFDWTGLNNLPAVGIHTDLHRVKNRRPLRWLRVTQAGKWVYYYQSLIDGRFYSSAGKSTTVETEIKKWQKKR